MKSRNIMDYTSNGNGDLLIDFLVDCGLCMLNSRIGINDFTHALFLTYVRYVQGVKNRCK